MTRYEALIVLESLWAKMTNAEGWTKLIDANERIRYIKAIETLHQQKQPSEADLVAARIKSF